MARRRSGKKIDFTHWQVGVGSFQAQAAGTSAVLLINAQHLPETLLRTRGALLSYADTTQTPGGSVRMTFGLILVPEGTGTTVLWSPETDSDAPWFYWSTWQIAYEEMVTDVIDVLGASSYREIVDSKAMRIVKNMEVQAVIENVTVGTAMGVNTQFSARFLVGT